MASLRWMEDRLHSPSALEYQVQRDSRLACLRESDELRGHLDSMWLVEQDVEQRPVEVFQNLYQ